MAQDKNSGVDAEAGDENGVLLLRSAAPRQNDAAATGEAVALDSQVFGDKTASVPVSGVFAERLRCGLPVLGLSVASLAVAGLAAGEPTPAAGFGLFLMLIGGLSAVTIYVCRG